MNGKASLWAEWESASLELEKYEAVLVVELEPLKAFDLALNLKDPSRVSMKLDAVKDEKRVWKFSGILRA